MVGHRWVRTLATAIVAVGASAALVATTLAARDRPWEPPACIGEGMVRVEQARTAGPPDPAAIAGEPWFRADPRLDGAGALDGQRLTVGRRGRGAPATIDLRPEAFAAGPFGDLILVGEDDGAASRLQALDAVAGCGSPVDSTTDVIRRATVSPDGSTVYEARVARRDRSDLGIWSRPLDGAAPARSVLPPPAPDGRFGRTWSTELAWSLEGDRLVVQSCGEVACRTRLFDPSDSSTELVDDPSLGLLIGVAGDRVIAHGACRGFPCPIVATDAATGARQVLADASGPAVIVSEPAAVRVVHEVDGIDGRRLRAVASDGSGATVLGPIPAGLGLGPVGSGRGSGLRLPPGWVLLAPDGRLSLDAVDARLILRRVPDGRSVRLDEVLP
jgi:hypothetical protein